MRRRWLTVAVVALVLAAGNVAWAAGAKGFALVVSGRVTGPGGQEVAGALLSDGYRVAVSDAQGRVRLPTFCDRVVVLTAPPGYVVRGRWWWPARRVGGGHDFRVWAEPSAKLRRVALLADPHLWPQASSLAARARARWRSLVSRLRLERFDLTIVAGDVLFGLDHRYRRGGAASVRRALAAAQEAVAGLPPGSLLLPGNHDVIYNHRVDLLPWRRVMGPARQVRMVGSVAFILLDNTGYCGELAGRVRWCGRMGPEALGWLERVLRVLPRSTPLVLVTHYPPLSPLAAANPLSPRALARGFGGKTVLRSLDQSAVRVWRMLAGRRLLAWVHGHLHAYHRSVIPMRRGSWNIIGLPAVSGGWWRGDRKWGPLRFGAGYVVMSWTRGSQPRFEMRPLPGAR